MLSPFLLITVLEASSREIRSGCLKVTYVYNLALVSGSLEGLKGKLKVWKGTMDSKGLRVNVKKTKIMTNSKISGNCRKEVKFSCAV